MEIPIVIYTVTVVQYGANYDNVYISFTPYLGAQLNRNCHEVVMVIYT